MKYNARAGRRRWPRRVGWILAIFIVIVVGATIIVRRVYDENLKAVGSSSRAVTVTIAQGSSVQTIAARLKGLGLIRSTWAFEWYVSSKEVRDALQAGTY